MHAVTANGDSDQPGCSLVEALGIVVTVEAEIRTKLELESSCFCRIIFCIITVFRRIIGENTKNRGIE